MAVLEAISNSVGMYVLNCPGCNSLHHIYTSHPDRKGPTWSFNGNMEKPTFSPSLLVKYHCSDLGQDMICHSFIREGKWQFLNDCTHKLAGQTVGMIEVD